jgi:hypothetical protein
MAKKYRRVCLDMDGVLCDFYRGVARVLDMEGKYDEFLMTVQPTESNNYEFFGIPKTEILSAVDDAGEEFWVNLPAYEWVPELVSTAIRQGDGVSFLTSCGRFKHAHVGKIRWLKKHGILTSHTDVILSHRKFLHAGPREVLVDDYPVYLNRWAEDGGIPLLVSRAWNGYKGHDEADVLTQLKL